MRQKARELKLANAAITDMQMRQRDVAALDAKYTKELADAKAENDALRDDAAAGRRRLHIVLQRPLYRVQPPRPPAWIMQPPPDWQTPLNGIFHPQREADHYAKTTEGTQKYINEQWYRVAHIDGQLRNYCEQYTTASSGEQCLK